MPTTASGTEAALAAEDDLPIPDMQQTRDYDLAAGYGNPYRWTHLVVIVVKTVMNRVRVPVS
jgi:hypothetical protein